MLDFELVELWAKAENKLKDKHLIVVCNTKANPRSTINNALLQMETEYFSDDEFEQVASMFGSLGLNTDYFTSEDDFFCYIIKQSPTNLIVYNAAQSGFGPGRKSLVPAFCNLHDITFSGSNAYVVSLCRHKYHVNQILAHAGIPVPQAWLYSNGWLMGQHPSLDMRILLKPIYESASIGIDDTSVRCYSPGLDQLIFRQVHQLHQPIMAQEFIAGYEVEVPLLSVNGDVCQLPPIGISINGSRNLNHEILDYTRIYFDQYGFYDFRTELNKVANSLCLCAAETARILGMEGLCRVDFRVKPNGAFFVTDVSTNPHFVSHSSVNTAFRLLNLQPKHIAQSILSAAIEKQ